MRRLLFAGALAVGTAVTVLGVGAPAQATQGRVVVFENEATPLTVFDNPSGCHALPPLTHTVSNETDATVKIFTTPNCFGPSLDLAPNFGSHEHGVGSFSA